MKGIFSYDSRLIGLINKIVDYIYLFFLWALFSIPIITIGASTCAFHYTFNKAFIQERGYIWRSFIKSFKENFKQATGVFLLQIIVGYILVLDSYYTLFVKDNFSDIFSWVLLVCIVIAYLWTRYWFPYISCFEDKTRTVLKNCGLIMISNIHWSLLLFVLFATMLLLMYMYPGAFLIISVIFTYVNGLIFNHVLTKYKPPETEEDSNESEENEGVEVIEE